jgi:MOZ/SAS family
MSCFGYWTHLYLSVDLRSDLGQQAYKPYWASTIIDFLLYQSTESALSIMDISKRTSIMAEDIVYTLNQLGILKIINGVYFIAAERSLLTALAQKYPVKEPRVDPSKRDKFSIHSKKPSVEAEGINPSNSFAAGDMDSSDRGHNASNVLMSS